MIYYFSKKLFFYSIFNIDVANVKQFFEYHKNNEYFMFAIVYWNVDSTFKFDEIKKIFDELKIICIFVSN